MTKLKTISILGCGWLGFPLAKELMNDGYFVRGATTSADKLKNLESEGIDPYLVHFNPKLFSDRGEDFFKSECLFINIPPGKDRELYPDLISSMMELAVKWQV